jgi:hypothetical protein
MEAQVREAGFQSLKEAEELPLVNSYVPLSKSRPLVWVSASLTVKCRVASK